MEEIDGCALTFRTLQAPRDDYFRGAACSSQVHVTLGSSESAVVSFASSTADVESEVWFWRANDTRARPSGDGGGGGAATRAVGSRASYTSIVAVSSELWAPDLGAPSYSVKEARDVANTSGWASRESASYAVPAKGTAPSGLQAYKNPGAIYSSPVLHSVPLEALDAGATYAYATPDGAVRTRATQGCFHVNFQL